MFFGGGYVFSGLGEEFPSATISRDGICRSEITFTPVTSSKALVAQWIEHGSPKAGVGGSIPLWGAFSLPRLPRFLQVGGVFALGAVQLYTINTAKSNSALVKI